MADLNKFLGSSVGLKLHEQRERIREAGVDELHEVLVDLQSELLNLRTQAMLQQAANPMRIRKVRKLVARIHTELTARVAKATA